MAYSKLTNEATFRLLANSGITQKARKLRKRMTTAETLLWNELKTKKLEGLHFRRQHPYGVYIIDFYCFKGKLAIEIDGPIHLGKLEYDNERTKYIESTGIKGIRFKNEDVENRMVWVLGEILRNVYYPLPSSPKGTRTDRFRLCE